MIALALLIYLTQSAGGFLLLHLLWGSKEPKILVLKIFLGPGMGAGVSSLLYFFWCWFNLPTQLYPFFELILLIALVVFAWGKSGWQELSFDFKVFKGKTLLWAVVLCAGVCLSVLNFWVYSASLPHGYYDAWAIWNLDARLIYGSGSQWLHSLPVAASGAHPDYPLLVPSNVAVGWLIAGSNSTRFPFIFSLLFMLSLLGLIFSSIFIARDFGQGALAATLVASLPGLAYLGASQYADIELAYFFLAVGILLYLHRVKSQPVLLILAGFFSGLAGWTKNEGQMFILVSLLVCLFLSLRDKKNHLPSFLAGLLFPLLAIILFKTLMPPSDLFVDKARSVQQLFDISRYQLILSYIGKQILSFGGWPVSFFLTLLLYSLVVRLRPFRATREHWLPFSLFLLQAIGYFVIYLITPYDLTWHLITSLERLMFHILPLMIFGLFNLLPTPTEIYAPGSQSINLLENETSS